MNIMSAFLLYSHSINLSSLMVYLLWGGGLLLLLFLIVLIFVQRRTGIRIRNELSELAKMRRGNIEYEFILKAMKLATWHIDPLKRSITIDNDFRENQDNYLPPPETNLDVPTIFVGRPSASRSEIMA